jgi:DNA-binding transcriptional LysR family regulator
MEHIGEGVTLDQLDIFVAVVDQGSFSAAARAMKRAQSAITYGVQGLELQIGTELFNRSTYRPTLTAAGVALLPRARRVLEAAATFRKQATNFLVGVETRLPIVVDVYVPYTLIVDALKAFREMFPLVDVSVMRQTMEATLRSLREGQAVLGIIVDPPGLSTLDDLERQVCGEVHGVPVAAPEHPLAQLTGPLTEEQLRDHMQVLLSSDPGATGTNDLGAHGTNRWRVNDLELRYRMIREGLGWGAMPAHMVEADIANGSLVVLPLDQSDPANLARRVPLSAAHLKTKPLGPAGRWLVSRISQAKSAEPAIPDR